MRKSILMVAFALAAGTWAAIIPPIVFAAEQSCPSRHWVRAWGAAPSNAALNQYENLTMRMIVTPLLGGDTLRLQLSNRFSSDPVFVGRVEVAQREQDASLVPGSSTAVFFEGRPSVTIAPGGTVLSDPVAFSFSKSDDLAVSFYIPNLVGSLDQHFTAMQTSYRTDNDAGDHVSDPDGAAFTGSTTSWFLLSGIDVWTTTNVGAVVAFGDSITDGFQGNQIPVLPRGDAVDANARYPDWLARRLEDGRLSVVNSGISGNRLRYNGFIPQFGPSGLSRLGADAVDIPGVTTVILLEGINDLGLPPNATHVDVIRALAEAVDELRSHDLTVLLGTLTPSGGTVVPTYGGPQAHVLREKVNAWIRGPGAFLADGVVDFDAAIRDPDDPSRMDERYDSSDHLHPSSEGYRAMAAVVPLDALERPACTASGP